MRHIVLVHRIRVCIYCLLYYVCLLERESTQKSGTTKYLGIYLIHIFFICLSHGAKLVHSFRITKQY